MTTIPFEKYQATGNDFILIDNRTHSIDLSNDLIQSLCDRRFGIGADGIILIESSKQERVAFHMNFYNSDGSQSFCGNGSRCSIAFAERLGMFSRNEKVHFTAIDGLHEGIFRSPEKIEIKMLPPSEMEQIDEDYYIHTGSPHYIHFCNDLNQYDIVNYGKTIRYNERFNKNGVNVNLVCEQNQGLSMLTYERGVENETYSCGTGATAVALVHAKLMNKKKGNIEIQVKGGKLCIEWDSHKTPYDTVHLIGPAQYVFHGNIQL